MPGRRGGGGFFRGGARRSAAPRKSVPVSSRRTTGLYNRQGTAIRNVQAYTKAGGKTFNIQGRQIKHGVSYSNKVQQTSVRKAAASVMKKNPHAKAVSYTLHSSDGKHYAGSTANPTQRMSSHLSGQGATSTKQMNISHVELHPHRSVNAAKKNETRLYYKEKAAHGVENVRGAGHTRGFFP